MKKYLVTAALCAASVGALAETFEFAVTGSGSLVGGYRGPITGFASFTFADEPADAIYPLGGDFQSFDVHASFTAAQGNFDYGLNGDGGGSLLATIVGGQVASLDGEVQSGGFPLVQISFSGLSFVYNAEGGGAGTASSTYSGI